MNIFRYGKTQTDYLSKKDPVLGEKIKLLGKIKRECTNNAFDFLVRSVIAQQISSKSLETILKKAETNIGELTPKTILRASCCKFKNCGIPLYKTQRIKHIAKKAETKEIDFENLNKLNDNEVIETLTTLEGVGKWTAQMVLIFALKRPNILSYGDFGIRKGLQNLHHIQKLTKKDFDKFNELYSPYGTIAAFYLWEIARM